MPLDRVCQRKVWVYLELRKVQVFEQFLQQHDVCAGSGGLTHLLDSLGNVGLEFVRATHLHYGELDGVLTDGIFVAGVFISLELGQRFALG